MTSKADKYPNLKPFKPGQSGNPGGRAKGAKSPTKALRRLLALSYDELLAYKPQHMAEETAKRWLMLAMEGDGKAGASNNVIREIFNRVDGKIPDRIEASGDGSGINVVFRVAGDKGGD